MPWSASSTGDNEEFVLGLKPFTRLAMPTEKQSSFMGTNRFPGALYPGIFAPAARMNFSIGREG
jgi:hypothetical protein